MPTKPQVFPGFATLTYVLRHCCFNTERPCQRDRCLHSTCSSTGPSRWTIVRFQSQSGSWKVFGNTERPSHRDRCQCSTCSSTGHSRWTQIYVSGRSLATLNVPARKIGVCTEFAATLDIQGGQLFAFIDTKEWKVFANRERSVATLQHCNTKSVYTTLSSTNQH